MASILRGLKKLAISIRKAKRINELPPYLFAEIDRRKRAALARGVDLIDLGVGDPDIPTPPKIVEKLMEGASKPVNHRYPNSAGLLEFRQAVADWYKRRFGVKLDPVKEVLSLIGSKEGIANMAVAFVDPGDLVLVPNPCYPVYHIGASFCGGRNYFLPLTKKNHFLPDLNAIPVELARQAKMLWINYPNNPTGAVAEKDFFAGVVEFAHRHNIIVCHDAAYTEMGFDGYRPMSFLEVDGAKEAAIEALRLGDEIVEPSRKVFQERRDILVSGLRSAGIECEKPRATFYVWVSVPKGLTSAQFATRLLDEAGVVTTPGNGFGEAGEGYVRFTVCVDKKRLEEVTDRIRQVRF